MGLAIIISFLSIVAAFIYMTIKYDHTATKKLTKITATIIEKRYPETGFSRFGIEYNNGWHILREFDSLEDAKDYIMKCRGPKERIVRETIEL